MQRACQHWAAPSFGSLPGEKRLALRALLSPHFTIDTSTSPLAGTAELGCFPQGKAIGVCLGYGLVSRQGELLDQVKRRKRKQQDLRSLRSVACWHSGLASDSPPNDILTPPALDFCVLYAGDQAETYAALGAYVFANMPSVKKTLSDISMYSSTGRLK